MEPSRRGGPRPATRPDDRRKGARPQVRLTLRLPPGLHETSAALAAKAGVSHAQWLVAAAQEKTERDLLIGA